MPFKHNALSVSIALALGITGNAAGAGEGTGHDPPQTGSRVNARLHPLNPITVITREDIGASGEISIADVLRQTPFNSFGSARESSDLLVQGQAQIDLRGLGPQRTLVLLDGRRLAGTANQSGGQIVNLNLIPLAAVERIEILRDGASAVYGSDAIGGVINIILRKDYEGLHLAAQWDKPTQPGGDGNYGQIVAGVTSARGNITVALDHQERKIIFDRDRPFSAVGLSVFGFPGSFGRVVTGGTFNIIAGDPNTGLTFSADPRCPTALGQDPRFPNSQFNPANGICNFNFAAISASAASLRRDSLFVNTNYELSDTVNFFGRFTSSNNKSFGRYAPAPFTAPYVSLAASNPNNPTIGEAGGPYDLTVLFRTVPVGPRDSTAYDTLFDVVVGLDGTFDWFGGFDWEFALQHSRTQIFTPGENYGIREFLQNAVDDGSLDLFSGVPNPNVLNSIRHTIFQFAENRLFGGDITVNWDLLQTNSGPWPLALGFEYMDERFVLRHDAQTAALNVIGIPHVSFVEPGEDFFPQDAAGERSRYALFGELLVPIGARFETALALRHDHYSDFGDTTNPRLSAAFRPTDRLLLRGSYGKGFRAPDLAALYEPQRVASVYVVDTLGCFITGDATPNSPFFDPGPDHPCITQRYQTLVGGNPNLQPEQSDQWTAGAVWSPAAGVTVELSYYDIEMTNVIGRLDAQAVFDNELRAFQQGRPLNPGTEGDVIRGNDGEALLVITPFINSSYMATRGFDLGFEWRFAPGNTGDWRWWISGSKVIDFQQPGIALTPVFSEFVSEPVTHEIAGTRGAPPVRVNTGLDWSRGNWSASARLYYIDDTIADAPGEYTEGHIPSWTTWDIQFGHAFGWDGEVTVGIRNVADRDPPISPAFGFPNWSSNNYDAFGRIPYIRYEQDL